jgi:hypothetical protein
MGKEAPCSDREFEERLGELLQYLRDRFFGITYEIVSSKTIKREKNNETLVEAMCNFEKCCNDKKYEALANEKLPIYGFLKLALEKDAPFDSEYHLGIQRDRSGLSLPQKNAIAVQCAAQVLWHLEGSQIPSIEAMERTLLDRSRLFFDLLELDRFNNPRTIEDWVRAVFPVPRGDRKKGRLKSMTAFADIIFIPGIFTESGVSFPRLRFALVSITRVLKALDWQLSEIVKSRPIILLVEKLQFYPRLYVMDWIEEAYVFNGSIFDV